MFGRIRRLFGRDGSEDAAEATPFDGESAGHRYRLHREEQVLALSVPEDAFGVPLRPCLPETEYREFVSGSVLVQKAKQFDDGLCAAVELAAQRGAGGFLGKHSLLSDLRRILSGDGDARSVIAAAAALGSDAEQLGVSLPLGERARQVRDAFLAEELRAKPLGFYTWTDELGRIFRQDRLLQENIAESEDLLDTARAIHGAPELRAAYEAMLGLVERLTNPLSRPDFRPMLRALDAPGSALPAPAELSFGPPSISHESELVKRLYVDKPIPEGFDLIREVIAGVRAGTLDLAPREVSGWYDVQTWALETLVAPERGTEAAKLVLDPSYLKHLEEMFRGILALTRETHVKQLEMMFAGCAPQPVVKIFVRPQLTVEPLVTHYLRRADGYRFVRGILLDTFGASDLDTLHRLRATGPVTEGLGTELESMIHLFDGAAATAMRELGMPTSWDASPFKRWAASDDPDVHADARMMVPLYFDIPRGKVKVLAFLGWSERPMQVSFVTPPRVELLDGNPRATVELVPGSYPIASPVVVELLVSRLLDRDEFRRLCDAHGTRERIVAALA